MSSGSSIGGSALVKWIENHRFFGRPKALKVKRQQTCEEAQTLADFVYTFSSCRELAAYTCVTPDAFTWTGDACICSTLGSYNSKFVSCVEDTRYSACIDPNNEQLVSEWSSGHCDILDSGPTTPTITSTTTSSEPKPAPEEKTSSSSVPEPKEPEPSAPAESKPEPKSEPPRSTDPPSTFIPVPVPSDAPSSSTRLAAEESSKEPEEKSKTSENAPTSVPQPSLVPVTVAPRVSSKATDALPSAPSIHVPLPNWTGSGNLLQGYCATPEYTIIEGPTAYWAPVIGCMEDKPDCCPFDIPPKTVIVGAIVPKTSSAASQVSGVPTATGSGDDGGFPSALSPAQATIERCPNDYYRVGDGCCPSNYFPWSTAFGGQTPCYSTILTAMTPPPIPPSLVGPSPEKPTSAIVNVVYAMQYPVQPEHKQALATPTKIGIGVGGGVAAIVFGVLSFLLIWKHRQHKKDKAALDTLSGMGSTRQSVAASSTVGGVREWRKGVPNSPADSRFHEGLETIPEPTLPNVGMTQMQQYPSEWRPGQRSVSPPVPLPPAYTRNSIPSPVGFSEADSRSSILDRRYSNNNTPGVSSDGGYESTNRSELQSGNYSYPRQELQGVPEGQQFHPQSGYYGGEAQSWAHEGVPQQVVYHEVPTGRMTPRV